jgi:hypothetical protein
LDGGVAAHQRLGGVRDHGVLRDQAVPLLSRFLFGLIRCSILLQN